MGAGRLLRHNHVHPINHIGPLWYFEIPFHFEVVNGKFPRDPNVGGPPEMSFRYFMSDLPPEAKEKSSVGTKVRIRLRLPPSPDKSSCGF
jgi:hypothetical protein